MPSSKSKGRGLTFVLLGLAAPPAAFLVTGKLVTPPPGMDGYVPAFLGGMVGLVVGIGLLVHGVRLLVEARGLADGVSKPAD